MGLDAGKVVAYLTLNTSGFESGIATGRSLLKTLQKEGLLSKKGILAVGDAAASIGKVMTLGLTTPLVGLGVAATTAFVSFDDAIRQVTATMEASEEEVRQLTEAAKEIGLTTQFSATQAAEALNALAAAGYDTEGAIAALPTVLKLSAAAGIGLESAASMLTDSMSALGLGVSDMEGFVDQLAKGASVSNASIAQLGEAVLTVGGTAKILKGGTVELNAELGILANNGLKGAEGGTMLRNVINALSAPTDQAAKVMKKYNLEAFDAQGNFRGLNDIFTDLAKVMDGWSDEKRASLMSELFNVRDLKAAEALMAGTTGLYSQFATDIENSQGAAQRFADTLSGGLSGSIDRLKAAVQGLMVEFGENLAPIVQNLADWVTNLARNWASMDEGMQETILTIAKVVAVAGPAILIFGKLTTAMVGIATAMTGPIGWITLGIAGVAALVVALASLPPQLDAVDAALDRVDPKRLEAVKRGLEKGEADLSINVGVKIPSAASIYDTVYASLTDGKPDTVAQGKQLDAEVQGYYDGLIEQVNLDTETKLANLKAQLEGGFITMEEYQTRANTITTSNGALILSVQQTCTDTLTYISTMSGKSTEAVQASLTELEDLKRRAEEARVAVAQLLEETASLETQRAQRLVKAGVKTDEETTGLAFSGAVSQYKLETYDAEQNAKGRRAAVDQIYDEESAKPGANLDQLKAEHDERVGVIEADLAADNARIQAAFLQSLNELFAGLASQNPEMQAQLTSALEKMNIAETLKASFVDGLQTMDFSGLTADTELMARLGAALGIDDPAALLQAAIDNGGALQVGAVVGKYFTDLMGQAAEGMTGLESSPMAPILQTLIEQGLLDGLDFDDANVRDKLALVLGQMDLPQAIIDAILQANATGAGGGVGVPLVVEPELKVSPPSPGSVQSAVEGAVVPAGAEGAPVSIPVIVAPEVLPLPPPPGVVQGVIESAVVPSNAEGVPVSVPVVAEPELKVAPLPPELPAEPELLPSELPPGTIKAPLLVEAELLPAPLPPGLPAEPELLPAELPPSTIKAPLLVEPELKPAESPPSELPAEPELLPAELPPSTVKTPLLVEPELKPAELPPDSVQAAVESAVMPTGEDGALGASVSVPVTVSAVPIAEEGAGQKLVDAVATGITDSTGAATAAGTTISTVVATAFGSQTLSAKVAGVNMVQGLIDGVNLMRASVVSQFEGLIEAAVAAAKKKAGIASPSKVFRGIGHNIADSFALGVDDRLLSSQRVVERLVGVPANATKTAQRSGVQPIDYDKLAAAVASRPVNLNLDGKTFATATAVDNTRAVAERQRRLDIGKGLV